MTSAQAELLITNARRAAAEIVRYGWRPDHALQHYLGHRNIQHTVRYTEQRPDSFRDFWQ